MPLHLNDVGTVIILTLKENGAVVDISSATSRSIKIRKPSGDTITRTGNFFTDGSDGKLYCALQSGDLDEVGTYRASMFMTIATWTGNSSSHIFVVDATP